MKRLIIILFSAIVSFLLLFSILSFSSLGKTDCEDAKSSAEEAYDYFKKAYNAESLDDARYYAKKGMSASSDAQSEAEETDCDCDDAASVADDAYTYGKKSYNSYSLSDAQYYAKKARDASEEITSEAEECEEE